MATMNLARALKLKNRLAGQLARIDTDIRKYNSVQEGEAKQVDVGKLLDRRVVLVDQLIVVKAALSAANQPIQEKIYRLAEHKAFLKLMQELSTRHGTITSDYADSEITYVAALKKADVDIQTELAEKVIDDTQEELDQFNVKTMLTVPDEAPVEKE